MSEDSNEVIEPIQLLTALRPWASRHLKDRSSGRGLGYESRRDEAGRGYLQGTQEAWSEHLHRGL